MDEGVGLARFRPQARGLAARGLKSFEELAPRECLRRSRTSRRASPAWVVGRCRRSPGLKLAGGAIGIEIQDAFARQRAIAGAILPNLLAGCEHHEVELVFDGAFQLAVRRLAE